MVRHPVFGIYVTRDGLCFKEAASNMHGHRKGCLYQMPASVDAATGYLKVTYYDSLTKKEQACSRPPARGGMLRGQPGREAIRRPHQQGEDGQPRIQPQVCDADRKQHEYGTVRLGKGTVRFPADR